MILVYIFTAFYYECDRLIYLYLIIQQIKDVLKIHISENRLELIFASYGKQK